VMVVWTKMGKRAEPSSRKVEDSKGDFLQPGASWGGGGGGGCSQGDLWPGREVVPKDVRWTKIAVKWNP